jgi:hypothetical protein
VQSSQRAAARAASQADARRETPAEPKRAAEPSTHRTQP